MFFYLVLLALWNGNSAEVLLTRSAYLRFPNENNQYTLDSGSTRDMAYDSLRKYLYVIGRDTGRYNVIDVNSQSNPNPFVERLFTVSETGRPLDIEICRFQTRAIIAVSFDGVGGITTPGHIKFYTPYDTVQDVEIADYYPSAVNSFTVGAHPDNIKFTDDCSQLVVACEGTPEMVGSTFDDPEANIYVLNFPADISALPTDSSINFNVYDNDAPLLTRLLNEQYRLWIVQNPVDSSTITLSRSMEPEYVAINGNRAFVTLQENNGMAVVNLGNLSDVYLMGLGTKDWSHLAIDTSDVDNAIHCGHEHIRTFYQPDKSLVFTWNNVQYLLTLDEGKATEIPLSTGSFTDFMQAKDKTDWNTGDDILNGELNDPNILGNLIVGNNEQDMTNAYGFGGRGFSIRDITNPNNPTLVFESADVLERKSRRYLSTTFNGDCSNYTLSPAEEADALSILYGPQPSAVAMGQFNGRTLIVIGGSKNGMLYTFSLQPTASLPQPEFESLHREGDTADSWTNIYQALTIGDAGITDIKFNDVGTPFIMVSSEISGSVAIYTLSEAQ